MSAEAGSVQGADSTAIAVGLYMLVVSLLWVLDLGGMTTRLLRLLYRRQGSLLWPFGSERSYMSFMRYGGVFVTVVAALLVVTGIAHR